MKMERSNTASSVASSAGPEISSPITQPMLRRHPASLVPRYMHDPMLLLLLKAPVNDEFIAHVAERTLAVVVSPAADRATGLPTPPTTPVKSSFPHRNAPNHASESASSTTSSATDTTASTVPSLTTFIRLTAARSNAQAPTLLVTLIYLERLRRRLRGAKAAKGMQCTYHRLFLASLIAAAKYCNDCCPRNKHWQRWSGLFTLHEVNLMEQELLMLLDHDLRIDTSALLSVAAPFLPRSSLSSSASHMDRNIPSLESCATTRTDSSLSSNSTSSTGLSTPDGSPEMHIHLQRERGSAAVELNEKDLAALSEEMRILA